jgi:hypothetical protein
LTISAKTVSALEAEAVLLILGHCEAGAWQWLSSAVVEEEVNNTPSSARRSRVRQMLSGVQDTVALTDVAIARAQTLKTLGFRTYDALHLACAEQATVDIFLTTDERAPYRHTPHSATAGPCGESVGLALGGDIAMNPQAMTLEQIREQGLALLRKHLGIVGMVRCLQQAEVGWGNYTEERHQWLGDPDLEELAKKIQAHYPDRANPT